MNVSTKTTRLAAGLGAVAVLTCAAGWVDARLNNRWSTPAELDAAALRLEKVPTHVGEWQMRSQEAMAPAVEEMLQCAGHFSRVYFNPTTKESVSVAAIVGPPGPTSVHTPEICYTSRDHVVVEDPTAVSIRPQERPDESFWRMTFRSGDLQGAHLRVYYAWSDRSGVWSASEHPRFKYSGQPLLYKIQLSSRLPPGEASTDDDSCQRFLRSFLPALNAALFP